MAAIKTTKRNWLKALDAGTELDVCAGKIKSLEKRETVAELGQMVTRIELGVEYLRARAVHAVDGRTRDQETGRIVRLNGSDGGFTEWLRSHSKVSKGHAYRCMCAAQRCGLDGSLRVDERLLEQVRGQLEALAESIGGVECLWGHLKQPLPEPEVELKEQDDEDEDVVAARVRGFVVGHVLSADTLIEELEELEAITKRRKRDRELATKAKAHTAGRLLAALQAITGQEFDTVKASSGGRNRRRRFVPVEHPELFEL